MKAPLLCLADCHACRSSDQIPKLSQALNKLQNTCLHPMQNEAQTLYVCNSVVDRSKSAENHRAACAVYRYLSATMTGPSA